VYWYSSANYGATVMRLVTRPSWRTVPGPTLAAGLARPELCRERRSHACGRPLALLLGVPGLFTAAPTALLLGALSLFHAAPAEAQVNAPTVQVASGNRKLTATFNTGGHPSTQVLRYRTRWRVKDTNPNQAGNQAGSWLPSATGHEFSTTYSERAESSRTRSVPPAACTSCSTLTNGTEYEVSMQANWGQVWSGWSSLVSGTPAGEPPPPPRV